MFHMPTDEECEILAKAATVLQWPSELFDKYIIDFCCANERDRQTSITWCKFVIDKGQPPYAASAKECAEKILKDNIGD